MVLHFAICDDDTKDINILAAMIKKWAGQVQGRNVLIRQFVSPYGLLDALSSGDDFDIFFLDILMPEMTGITLGEQIQRRLDDPLLIYLTTSEDYYSDAFRLYAFQYLCKPIFKDSLFPVLDRAASRCAKRKTNVFVLKTADGLVQIPLPSIIYVELLNHICHFHLADGQNLSSIYLRSGFDRFTAPLLQHVSFIKTHSSFVVNLDYAGKLTTNALFLTNGACVPIARSYASRVQQSYITYGLRTEDDL